MENSLSRKVVYGKIIAADTVEVDIRGGHLLHEDNKVLGRSFVVSMAILLAGSGVVLGTSLYPADKPSMFEDNKAKRAGDLVTVIIVEQAQARQTPTPQPGKLRCLGGSGRGCAG